jgi:formylglycine-generating enzyme required for sulfatase activity
MPAPLEPIGFWSYARSDDEASTGKLSTLRGLLRGELKLHWGRREVRIWQDVEAIAYGTTWLTEIERAIAESSFFIPIVTRAFLESKMCCQEVMLFHRRQLALGRNDMIFPFHFTDVSRVQASECEDPAVLPLLRERQAFDFSKLRLRDPHSEEVATKLASLAVAIDDALRRSAVPEHAAVTALSVAPSVPVPAARPPPVVPPAERTNPLKPAWASAAGTDAFGAWADAAIPARRGPAVTQRLRLVPAGRFMMGSPDDEPGRLSSEGPRHEVTIGEAFWLFDTPCTQALWQAVMDDNPSRFKSPTRPVESVSFEDAQHFLSGVNDRVPGLDLALPSEAQWEYACRAGTDTATYAGPIKIVGQHNAPVLNKIAWYSGNSGEEFDRRNGVDSSEWPEKQYRHIMAGTHLVKGKAPNAWGLYDMLGNVWEWCEDNWHDSYEGAPSDGSAWLGGGAAGRVIRGGSWFGLARGVRAAFRYWGGSEGISGHFGVRCARGHLA